MAKKLRQEEVRHCTSTGQVACQELPPRGVILSKAKDICFRMYRGTSVRRSDPHAYWAGGTAEAVPFRGGIWNLLALYF